MKRKWIYIIGAVLALAIIGNIVKKDVPPTAAAAATAPNDSAQQRKELIESGFSAWNGSHKALEKLVKDNMNDPNSFEHVKTKYWDLGERLVVLMTYRGKNAFGGVVTENVKAEANLDGTLIKVFPQE